MDNKTNKTAKTEIKSADKEVQLKDLESKKTEEVKGGIRRIFTR
ncbi:MAG: hypothetical protein V2J11_03110 [Desulfofustis sp.]|jgi:hypothetical protein|nr:hypothetical protein [Desulfofustis sp.]